MRTSKVRSWLLWGLVVVLAIGIAPAALASPASSRPARDAQVLRMGPSGAGTAWFDDFDDYATGSQMHGQGGWAGWDNSPGAGALTSSTEARSAPNSVNIEAGSDLVHEYEWPTSGQWTYTAWQFIPGSFSGTSYFIMLNMYEPLGTNNWSVQVNFDSFTNSVINDGLSGGIATIVYDEWVEIRVEIDLTANTQDFYYDGVLLYSGTWTEEVSGGGIAVIDAVDLFANGASPVYYDDMSLVPAGFAAGVALTKSPAVQNVVMGGDANFTIAITNTSTITLTNVAVSDPAVPDCDQTVGSLNPGASQSYSCTDTGVTASYTNTATVDGSIPGGPTLSASGSAVVNVVPPTGVTVSRLSAASDQPSNPLALLMGLVAAAIVGLGATLLVVSRRRRAL